MALSSGFVVAGEPAKPTASPAKCVVSGETIGSMGTPFVFTYEGREIQLCCKGCKATFDKNPAKYIEKLNAASKK